MSKHTAPINPLSQQQMAAIIFQLNRDRARLVAALQFAVEVLSKQNLAGANYAPVLQQARAALSTIDKEGQ